MPNQYTYQRILLKLSGERLCGPQGCGINADSCRNTAESIKALHDKGIEIGLVLGGGNIFRGINAKDLGVSRTPADQIGMLATIMNGVALQQALAALGCPSRVLSAIDCPKIVESYNWQNAMSYLKKNEVLIFVGGTGNPYFTTDTAAALRASEINAQILMKATKVDGVYNKDPLKFSDAIRYNEISYSQVLAEKLEVMDATSIALCMHNRIPILVFHMQLLAQDQIETLILGKEKGTLIH